MNFASMTTKELQDALLSLEKQINDHAALLDENPEFANEGSEWTSKWNSLNSDYDAGKAELDKRAKVQDRRDQIDARLSQIADRDGFNPNLLPEQIADVVDTPDTNLAELAIQGWLNSVACRPLTESQVNALRQERTRPGQSNVVLNWSSGTDFANRQRARRGEIENTLQIGVPSSGGVLTGSTLVQSIEEAILDFSGMMQVATVFRTTTGDELRFPYADDTSNSGAMIGEITANSTATDPSLGQLILRAHKFTSQELYVSHDLLEDAQVIDLAGFLGNALGTRIGRALNTKLTLGTGGGIEPQGAVTASGTDQTAANTTSIVVDDLFDLQHQIDPGIRMRPGIGWMMHDNIFKAIRKLKDGNSLPIWESNIRLGMPDSLLGKPVFLNQDMQSSIATATQTMLYGDLRSYFVRQVGDMRLARLVEREAATDREVFIVFHRYDGGLMNPGVNPLESLTQA